MGGPRNDHGRAPRSGGTMDRMLKSVRKLLPGRPQPAQRGRPQPAQRDVETLRSANAVAPVGLWPRPRA
jgi:hypothetical protein